MTESVKNRILLVEDEAILAMTEKMQLEKYGYAVRTVTSGEKAVDATQASSDIDLILMDIDLGAGMDGTQASEIILKDHDIPIVFLSSHTEPEIVEKTEKITSYGYVVKNSNITVLDASIKMAFKLSRADKQLTEELTERQRSEEAMREQRDFSESLIETAQTIILVLDTDGNIVRFNPYMEELVGYSIDEVKGMSWIETFIRPENGYNVRAVFRKTIDDNQTRANVNSIITKDGRTVIVEWHNKTLKDASGQTIGVLATGIDITERKQAEEEIKEYANRLELTMEAANIAWWEMYIETGKVNFSSKKAEMLDYSSDQFHHYEDFTKLVHPDDYKPMMTSMRALLDGQEDKYDIEYRIKAQSGEYRWFRDMGTITQRTGEGKPLKVSGIVIHITERKQAEEKYQSLFNYSNDAIFVHEIGSDSIPGKIVEVNEQACRLFQYSREQLLQMSMKDITPEKIHSVMPSRGRMLMEKKQLTFESEIIRRGSVGIPVEVSAYFHAEGSTKFVVSSVRDITARKQAEEAVAQKTRLLEASQALADLGSWEWDIVHDTWYFSEQWKRIHGVSDDDFDTSKLMEIAHPEDAPHIERAFSDATEQGKPYDIEHRIIRVDNGEIRYVKALGEAEFDPDTDRPVRMMGAVQDITARKRAEEELRESEERFRHMVNVAPLGIAITDSLTGEFFLVNPAMSRITGRSVEELERIDWVSITHPDDIQPDKEKMAELIAGKISGFQLEKRFLHADGHYFWVNITVAPMHVTDKAKPRHLLMVEDITERKQAEKEIQKQLSEKELLLREIHHRVKNNIANVESLLSLQAASTVNAEVKAGLQDAFSRVQSMRVLYDKLLFSEDLHEVSVKSYAESLIDSLVTFFDPESKIRIEKQLVDFTIPAKQATTVGIILNELLTNVFKYAFRDRENGLVSVSIEKKENEVSLIIEDNGVGFDERALANKSPGFGLTVVKMLAEQLGGTYTLSNDVGAKTVVQFAI